jgi:hypothetical protein
MSSLAIANSFADFRHRAGTFQRMKSSDVVAVILVYLSLANFADAQLSESKNAGERQGPVGSDTTLNAVEQQTEGEGVSQKASLCKVAFSAAATNGLPFEFFARVIWQESRFNSSAVGPVTRGGQRAQGIAQFMPGTASERLVRDPFDPLEALPKSAAFLRELQLQFGNLGLAAAAYNAGPQRVRDWLSGMRTLPPETQTYVRTVTGHPVQEWALPKQIALAVAIPKEMSCVEGAKLIQNPQSPSASPSPRLSWVAQLIGDSSETIALTRFRQLQNKLRSLLGTYEPVIARTMLRARAEPIWTRIRIEMNTRQAAESLCSKLESAGEHCLVQRN